MFPLGSFGLGCCSLSYYKIIDIGKKYEATLLYKICFKQAYSHLFFTRKSFYSLKICFKQMISL